MADEAIGICGIILHDCDKRQVQNHVKESLDTGRLELRCHLFGRKRVLQCGGNQGSEQSGLRDRRQLLEQTTLQALQTGFEDDVFRALAGLASHVLLVHVLGFLPVVS